MSTTASNQAISISDLGVEFNGQSLYRNLDFSAIPGEFLCIVGPSGCGKSTLLRVFGGLLKGISGSVTIYGEPPETGWKRMSYVFQSPRLAAWRTALENVMLAGELRFERPDKAELRREAEELLALVGLSKDAHKYPAMLSGGERQRVSIARALAVKPEIILMDEPFSALDLKTRERLRSEILNIWKKTGKTIVFVTHDVEEAIVLADRIVVLTGKPTKVLEIIPITHQHPRQTRENTDLISIKTRLENTMRGLETHNET